MKLTRKEKKMIKKTERTVAEQTINKIVKFAKKFPKKK